MSNLRALDIPFLTEEQGNAQLERMKSDYVIWRYKPVPGGCALKTITGIDKLFRLSNGTALIEEYPSNVVYSSHPEYPEDLGLTDNMNNLDRLIIGSKKLKIFLEKQNVNHVEYLPIAIADSSGNILSRDYFIIHPVNPIECIDVERSTVEWDIIDSQNIEDVTNIVLDENKIPTNRVLFKDKRQWDLVFLKHDLAKSIEHQCFSGFSWLPLEDYKGHLTD